MSVEPPTHEEIQIDDEVEEVDDEEEEEEEVDEEEDVDEEEEEEEIEEVTHGRSTGRGLTLKTLVKEGILQPGEGLMTINYLVRLSYDILRLRVLRCLVPHSLTMSGTSQSYKT